MLFNRRVSSSNLCACSGWTLLELLIAITIIGSLVTIAIPNYMRVVERNKCIKGLQQVKTMRNAALMYHRENLSFSSMDITALEKLAGTRFIDDADWAYSLINVTNTSFQVQATRQSGNWNGDIIVVDEKDSYTGTSYPINDPGGW